ncbi:hypothetical protein F7Q99_21745 [Streptomyces kaniharaensis]|uniref:Uncharacterized protein n=1 Tax=Streptomyces kaniharaensis TaxID=212423 RepID=A0A6N7KZ05_9ACTN|nr:hypothetical protein [Streptomyces kaniharaensis]MQS14813.1 hypothetical protein [Streptomyces kaniharaensis]
MDHVEPAGRPVRRVGQPRRGERQVDKACLVGPWIKEIGPKPEDGQSIWPDRTRDTQDERFGEELRLADGARATAWLRHKDEGLERDLRCLALARGVM